MFGDSTSVYFLVSVLLSIIATPLIRKLAVYLKCVDVPGKVQDIHERPTPLLGGWAIFLAFVLVVLLALYLGEFNLHVTPLKFLLGIFIGGFILMLGGYLDDRYTLPAKLMWVFPGIASLVIVLSGIGVGIKFLTNPLGGTISLDYHLLWGVPLSAVFTWVWLMVATYTTKILDGMDGLASGVGAIAAIIIFILSLRPEINQPTTALLAIILAGALCGYLFFAWHPAKIFLGESGSTFIGFTLGTLAVLTGAKVATAIIVMGLPLLDVVWAVIRRTVRRQNPFKGDREHLHHLFLNAGLSHRQSVLCYYVASLSFGLVVVFLQARGKFLAIILLILIMSGLVLGLSKFAKHRQKSSGTA